jgi:hypothetical protein
MSLEDFYGATMTACRDAGTSDRFQIKIKTQDWKVLQYPQVVQLLWYYMT